MPTNVDINKSIAITAAIIINVIGPCVFIVQPGFVQGLVEHVGFSEREAGYVAAVEMWGIAITTLILVFLSNRLNWRSIIRLSAILMITGNLASIIFQDPIGFAVTRGIVGIGAGGMISLGFTILGLTRNPDRNFGYMIMWVLLYGAIVMALLPIIFETMGMNGLLVFFALFASISFLFVRNLPDSAEERVDLLEGTITVAPIFRSLAVASVFMFFVGIGAIWTYLFLIGINAGGTEQQIANALMLSQFAAVAGALTAATLANRFGRIRPVTAGLLGCLIPQFFLFNVTGIAVYIIAVCVFNFAYNMTHPYFYAVLSSIDRSGQIIRYAVAGQMIGAALGPSIAASVVESGSLANVITVAIVAFAISLVLIFPPLLNHGQSIKQPVCYGASD